MPPTGLSTEADAARPEAFGTSIASQLDTITGFTAPSSAASQHLSTRSNSKMNLVQRLQSYRLSCQSSLLNPRSVPIWATLLVVVHCSELWICDKLSVDKAHAGYLSDGYCLSLVHMLSQSVLDDFIVLKCLQTAKCRGCVAGYWKAQRQSSYHIVVCSPVGSLSGLWTIVVDSLEIYLCCCKFYNRCSNRVCVVTYTCFVHPDPW